MIEGPIKVSVKCELVGWPKSTVTQRSILALRLIGLRYGVWLLTKTADFLEWLARRI